MDAPRRVDESTTRLGGPGYELVERAQETSVRYGMLDHGDHVVVAVSGGPDSVCLLDVLARIETRLELTLSVAHVDHGLAPDSAELAARVASRVAEAGFDIHVGRAPDLAGPNLHARARDFRYAFLTTIAEQVRATRIATGHTLDDRAETTLARLVHGAGTEGLAGIPPVDGTRIRPLIDIRRSETRAYCEARGIEFFDDPANDDPRFERTAIRSKLLSAIEAHWGEGAVTALAHSSERLREDAVALSSLAGTLFSDFAKRVEEGTRFDLDVLLTMPRALRRRVLEMAVGRIRDRSGGIEAALDALEHSPKPGSRFAVASGFEIVVHADHVLVTRRAAD